MSDSGVNRERELRWFESPIGRGVINGVALVVLLSLTQQFGWTEPGPPVRLENLQVYACYGLVVGLIMYAWTSYRLQRDRRRREEERRAEARRAAYEEQDQDDEGNRQ